MKKVLLFLVPILLLIVVITFIYFDDGKQVENFDLGYKIDEESQKMEKTKEPLDLEKKILVSVDYQYPKDMNNEELVMRKLIVKKSKTEEIVFEKHWEEDNITSGYSFSLDITKLNKGTYKIQLYKNNKLVKEKTYEFS
ncbi:hypothetical protein [Metabacillus fastidiosus]|uniref:YtkA-like domain-containing protein n=1 Tax=Metabacillus fastidiosus TaxID=1458 RepID=A0ABU6NYQ2_9BACI|nr:hypothetical protein [Metabacillus fastidiosus]MED4402245.1 hypothetical protein [Metabacillus fastidiosus]MED4462116.1 hypothetical protein [Metabacillus fastidiosus]